MAGNIISGRKSAFLGPESIQKPYIDHPTQYGVIFWKVKKNIDFLTPKIMIKIFSKSISFCWWGPATKSILEIDTSYWCPQDVIILLHWPHPFSWNVALKSQYISKSRPFSRKCYFFCVCCFWILLMLFFRISKIRKYY